jgi:threonine/homoserine/homoserine lactone efflux protein
MVYNSQKKTGQFKTGLPQIMRINILVMLLDWIYIGFFIFGQFVFSFVDLGRDLRQTAVAFGGLHVVGKTYVLYLMMKLLVNPSTLKKPTDPGKPKTREAKVSEGDPQDTCRT